MNDLKPCPFCGGEAKVIKVEITMDGIYGRKENITVGCSICDATIEATRKELTYERWDGGIHAKIIRTGEYNGMSAIEQWNRRSSDE